MQKEPPHSRNSLFRSTEIVSLIHPTFLPSRGLIAITIQALFSRKWSNDLLLCLFTSTKQAQQLRKQLNGVSRERGVLLFWGKWNQQGQKKPPPFSNTSWGCIEGFQLTALACLCLIIVHSLIENPARTPHLRNNRPFLKAAGAAVIGLLLHPTVFGQSVAGRSLPAGSGAQEVWTTWQFSLWWSLIFCMCS